MNAITSHKPYAAHSDARVGSRSPMRAWAILISAGIGGNALLK
ncbi:MAG: hypothetical protein U1F54_20620 [Burkholderiales bacterium]